MSRKPYKRVLIKFSGEIFEGKQNYGIELDTVVSLAAQIKELYDNGIQIGIVIGGGNIFRGISGIASGMNRSTADYMGMLATVINSLALQDALDKINVRSRVMSALEVGQVAELYVRRNAVAHIQSGKVVIFAAGTGNPAQGCA